MFGKEEEFCTLTHRLCISKSAKQKNFLCIRENFFEKLWN